MAWLVTATLVAGAVCVPLLGRLGDMAALACLLLAISKGTEWGRGSGRVPTPVPVPAL